MNNNLERLYKIKILLDELINVDLKLNTGTLSQIINLISQIKSNVIFLINEFYFTSIIEFEQNKIQILHKLIYIKNLFFTYSINNGYIIKKINYIKTLAEQVFYPAYLNTNNIEKYIKEIKRTKIKFYHKSETMNENLYDDVIEFEDDEIDLEDDKKISSIKIKLHNNQNYVINKIKGKKFLSNINFFESYINI